MPPSPDNRTHGRLPLPWALVAALAVLAAEVLILRAIATPPTAWQGALGLLAAAATTLILVGWLTHYLWGLAAAVIVPLHPVFAHAAGGQWEAALLAPVLQLAVAAAVLGGCRLLREPAFTMIRWTLAGAVLIGALTLLWPLNPPDGLAASLLVLIGLTAGAVLALQLRRRDAGLRPGNAIMASLLAWLVPAASYFLASNSARFDFLPWQTQPASSETDLDDLLRAAIRFPDANAFSSVWANRNTWAWPLDWVVLPLMAYGLWRALRRGFKEKERGRLPLTWMLPLFSVIALLGLERGTGDAASRGATLAALAIVLTVFCFADVARGIGERLVLAPPTDAGAPAHTRIAAR